jgi:hypothetical protein
MLLKCFRAYIEGNIKRTGHRSVAPDSSFPPTF